MCTALFPKNWQILSTRNQRCIIHMNKKQTIPQNPEILDNFDYGMALENELGVLYKDIIY